MTKDNNISLGLSSTEWKMRDRRKNPVIYEDEALTAWREYSSRARSWNDIIRDDVGGKILWTLDHPDEPNFGRLMGLAYSDKIKIGDTIKVSETTKYALDTLMLVVKKTVQAMMEYDDSCSMKIRDLSNRHFNDIWELVESTLKKEIVNNLFESI